MATATDISLREASDQLGVSYRTMLRWVKSGVNGRRLDAWKLGGRWFTSLSAIEEFRTRPQQAVIDRAKDAAREAYERALEL